MLKSRLPLLIFVWLLSGQPASPKTASSTHDVVARALPVLQKSASVFVEKRACFSCHHNGLSILTLRAAQDRGFSIDTAALGAIEQKTFRELRNPKALDDAVQAANLSDPTPNDSLLLMAAHAADLPRDTVTAVIAQRMAAWQREGHWVTSDFRPPHSSSLFAATATAVRALQFYLPGELSGERNAGIGAARRWLVETHPDRSKMRHSG